MRIAIGITVGEIIKPATVSTIALMSYYIGRNGHEFTYLSEQSAYLEENANNVFQRAIEYDADYLFMIETDVAQIGSDDFLPRWIGYDQDVVSGIYYGGKYPHRPLIHGFTGTLRELYLPGNTPEDSPFYIDAVGSGFMLISRKVMDAFTSDVINRLGKPFDFFYDIEGKLAWRQDLAFCWRLKELGFNVLVDPTIKLGHSKEMIITETYWNASRAHMEETGEIV